MFTDMDIGTNGRRGSILKQAIRTLPLLAAAILLLAGVAQTATATIQTTFSSTLTQGQIDIPRRTDNEPNYRISFDNVTSDNALGAHADFTTSFDFDYGATGVSGGVADPGTYADGSDWRETLKNVLVDLPPGLVGNPNAVPYDERCDEADFLAGDGSDENPGCPESATVGELWMKASVLWGDQSAPGVLSVAPFGPKRRSSYRRLDSGFTRVSLLKTPSEVPARIGIFARGPVSIGRVKTILEIVPVDDDLHLQARTVVDIPSVVINYNEDPPADQNIRIERMVMSFFGRLPNGRAFMTSPTSCKPWTTSGEVSGWYGAPGGDNPPATLTPASIDPDCSNSGSLPFPISGSSSLSTPERGVSPDVDFALDMPGAQGDAQASSTPKKIVTTLPSELPIDVAQLSRICEREDFRADACATSTRVGTVKLETPLISAGLSGDVYLVRKEPGTSGNLPDLGLRVRGAITFTQLGTNRYVGADFNQVQTTFDNIPEVGFSKLKLHLFGGEDGLLRSADCPDSSATPASDDVNWAMDSWSGRSAANNSSLKLANCFGVRPMKSPKKCVRIGKRLKLAPKLQSLSRVKKLELRIKNKRRAKDTKRPFRVNVKLQKKFRLKKNRRYKMQLRATYDDGTVKTRTVKVKICRS